MNKPDHQGDCLPRVFKAHCLEMGIEIIYKNMDITMFFKKFLIFSLKGGNY